MKLIRLTEMRSYTPSPIDENVWIEDTAEILINPRFITTMRPGKSRGLVAATITMTAPNNEISVKESIDVVLQKIRNAE